MNETTEAIVEKKYVIDQLESKIVFHKNMIYGMFDNNGIIESAKESFYVPLNQISSIRYGKIREIKKGVLLLGIIPGFILFVSIIGSFASSSSRSDGFGIWGAVSMLALVMIVIFSFKIGRYLRITSANNLVEIKIGGDAVNSTTAFVEAVNQSLSK